MDREKYVDESWKESAEKEKERLEGLTRQAAASSRPDQRESSPPPDGHTNQRPGQQATHESEPTHQEQESGDDADGREINFLNYTTGLVYQAMVFLGEIPNPATNLVDANYEQAKFVIDTLIMLRTKTKGNLTKRESDTINAAIYELQMKFVEISQRST